MDIEKKLSRKQFISSLFFTIVFSVVVLTIIIGLYENKNVKLKKKEALLKSKYGSSQVALLREIFSDKNLSPEEYDEKVDTIVNAALEQVRYKRTLKQESGITYGNLIYDLYLASEKWDIKDENKLSKIQFKLKSIAEEELETSMGRYMGEVGIKQARRDSDRYYQQRLDVIEEFLPHEKRNTYSAMKKSLNSIFN